MLLKLLLFCICVVFSSEIYAQQSSTDSAARAAMIKSAVDIYKNAVAENSSLYNGTEYIGYVARPAGHPFFETQKMELANVYYDGVLFRDIPILYDLVNDQIIIDNYAKTQRIILNSEKVTFFEVGGHFFIRPQTDTATGNAPGGFYERLYNGKTKVLVKRKKQITSITTAEGIRERYDQYNYYFIKADETYTRVTSRESLIKAFHKNRGEIRKFMREYENDFRKDMENIIIKVAEFNDSIKD